MKKKIISLNIITLLMVALFFAVTAGGCGGGGGSSLSNSSSNNSGGSIAEADSATRPVTLLGISLAMDSNGNGKPDFLDFNGVPQIHIKNSVSTASLGKAAAASSVLAAAEMNVTVPSMVWINNLRPQSEDPNLILFMLEAGNEYTFEFSKNLTSFAGSILPNIKFYDPSNAVLSLDRAEEMTNVEITAYPKEHPSLFCYTIKPEVSGHYLVRIQNGEPVTNTSADFDAASGVLFIYKERRNENGEAGYYTNFKFKDENGNMTETIPAESIIELRQLFLEANPTYFDEVYGQDAPDDDNGAGNPNSSFVISDDQAGDYADLMDLVQYRVGLEDLIDLIDPEGYLELTDEELIALLSEDISIDNEAALYKEAEAAAASYDKALEYAIKYAKVVRALRSNTANASAGLDDMPSSIPSSIEGIPYEDRYHIGRGAMAVTFLDPPGGMEIGTIKEAYDKAFSAYDYDGNNTGSSKDVGMHPVANPMPLMTDKYIKFVSTASQAETLTKTTNEVSLATSALGISAGTGSTNNFKFGITSTTLVIHFEETEVGYRELSYSQTLKAWQDAGLFDVLQDESFYQTGPDFVKNFRNDFGDYYVSGYQYGACYDAYIAITTKTSEQIDTVKRKLLANLNLDNVTASADLSKETKNVLAENEAEFSIRIVTNGMGQGPTEIPMPEGVTSRDNKAIDHTFDQLLKFTKSLTNTSKRANYAPVRVMMSRWKRNLMLGLLMKKKGDVNGTIPLTVGKKNKIIALNTKLKTLRGYNNVVMDNSAISSTASKTIGPEFNVVMNTISSVSDDFYGDKYQSTFDSVDKKVDELIPKFKALSDRYVFYTKLVLAQQAEKKYYSEQLSMLSKFEEGSDNAYKIVRQMPFGPNDDKGGSSGYDQFAYSEYVQADMDAGETVARQYERSAVGFARLEWNATSTGAPGTDPTAYWAPAGPAILEAKTKDGTTARFCKVTVESMNASRKTDRHRELGSDSSPAVGKSVVKFYFMSGRGDDVDWNISGKSMRMRQEDYPFSGLE